MRKATGVCFVYTESIRYFGEIGVPHGIETIQSQALQTAVPFAVVLPEGSGPFPVLYDLHGLLSDEGPYDPTPTDREYFEKQPFRRLQKIANNSGVALVRVNGGRSWYLDSPRIPKSQYETHIIHEVIPSVELAFPLIGTTLARGVSGHSMGGFGAMSFLCRHPNLFSVGAVHCASLRFMPPEGHRGSYIEDLMSDDQVQATFPDGFLEALIRDDLKLRITVGEKDKERIVRGNQALHTFLLEKGKEHFYEETPGGHEYVPHGFHGVEWAAQQLKETGC